MALPYLKQTFYLPFYFQQLQWRLCTVRAQLCLCMSSTLTTVHQKPCHGKGVQRRGQLSRVNGTIKMQQALNIQINAKSDPFPNLLFFLQNCGQRKAATDPPYSGLTIAKQQKVSPRVCDFQPPCRSHAHLF